MLLNRLNSTIALIPRRLGLGALLLTLHTVLVSGPGGVWADALMMIHYGLFLLWQPIWRGEQKMEMLPAVLFVVGGVALLAILSWWMLAFWLAGLIGLLGGRVISSGARGERIANMVAVGYLLTMLLIWVEPHLLGLTDTLSNAYLLVHVVLPVIPLGLLFAQNDRKQMPAITVDFFYCVMLFLLVVILVLGSFIIRTVGHEDYVMVLVRAMFVIAAVLAAMSWLWNPRAGFSGLGELLSRYLMSVGMPFEQWLQRIAVLAETSPSSTQFLNAATQEVSVLPWVSGGAWEAEANSGQFGETSPYKASFSYHGLQLTLFARNALSPALTLHIKLLAQLLGEFYEAKLREEQMRGTAYLQAVYETGARLTHDIKNLLQSLNTLCAVAERVGEGDQTRLLALIQRQLPQLSQRLQSTLEKLQAPQPEPSASMNAITWWNQLRQRYRDSGIEFQSERIAAGTELPSDLFDSVVDNLLHNALEKRKSQSALRISVVLQLDDDAKMTIEDDGEAIPSETAERLFKSPLPSASGLGIGLYQAAKQAAEHGFALTLVSNRNGLVRFEVKVVRE